MHSVQSFLTDKCLRYSSWYDTVQFSDCYRIHVSHSGNIFLSSDVYPGLMVITYFWQETKAGEQKEDA